MTKYAQKSINLAKFRNVLIVLNSIFFPIFSTPGFLSISEVGDGVTPAWRKLTTLLLSGYSALAVVMFTELQSIWSSMALQHQGAAGKSCQILMIIVILI